MNSGLINLIAVKFPAKIILAASAAKCAFRIMFNNVYLTTKVIVAMQENDCQSSTIYQYDICIGPLIFVANGYGIYWLFVQPHLI